MKKITFLLFVSLIAFISCRKTEVEPQSVTPPKIDLSNIKDSAYFLIKWQGKEIFMKENLKKDITLSTWAKATGDMYTYNVLFSSSKPLHALGLNVVCQMPEQRLSILKNYLSAGYKKSKKPSEPCFILTYSIGNENYFGIALEDDEYFEILESRGLLEERDSPTEILVKYRFRLRMSANNKFVDYMEGEAQTRVRYIYVPK